jgi:hypothetical protein
MKVHFTAPHPLFGRVNKRLTLSHQQRSPYYWWWAFLRRNEEYLSCCERGGTGKLAGLYENFGDVRGDDFHAWWTKDKRGARLFGEKPLPLNLKELKNASEWDSEWHQDGVMVIAVPLNLPKRHLEAKFSELLKNRHDGRRGRKKADDAHLSTAKYQLHRNVSVPTLRIQLDVYDAVMAKKRGEVDKTLARIGQDLKLVASAMPRSTDLKDEAEHKRNVMTATVSRHFKAAERIVANVIKGQFPNSAGIY